MMQGYDPLGSNPLGSSGDTYQKAPLDFFEWERTLISQYANSPVILALVRNMASHIDPTADFDNFYTLVWNVDTAQGYGLDVWGRIVGVNRVLKVAVGDPYFGFEEATDAETFNNAAFYSGNILTENFALADNSYRTLVFAKALSNITDGSIQSINQIMMNLFPSHGNCYVQDNGDMTLAYVFGSKLSPVENSIVAQSGVLPKPVGVTATIVAP